MQHGFSENTKVVHSLDLIIRFKKNDKASGQQTITALRSTPLCSGESLSTVPNCELEWKKVQGSLNAFFPLSLGRES